MPFDIDATVLSNVRLSDDYNVVGLAAPDIARRSRPGQFVMVRQPDVAAPLLRRPFSVFEILRDETGAITGFSLLNKAIGVVTRTLLGLEPGARLQCLGPLGQPFSTASSGTAVWMVAGGVGLAPFLTLAESARARGLAARLFYGGRSAGDLYYAERFAALGVEVVLTTDDGTRGTPGRVTGPLERALGDATLDDDVVLYACGPTPMMRAVAALAERFGRRVEVSLEPIMGCGLGGCYSCVVPVLQDGQSHYVRSCLEGPVFDGGRLAWEQLA